MASRGLRISVLAFAVLWFGAFLPGHERGAIQLPGYSKNAAAPCDSQSHCSSCPVPATDSDSAPARKDPSHCAICHFIGLLDAPVTVEFTLPEAQQLECLSPPAIESIASVAMLDVRFERGPPLL